MDAIDYPRLWKHLSAQFLLGESSLHGPRHWRRVEQFGLKIAAANGADLTVVKLFAVFHDSRRENESWDPQHGARGAELAQTLRGDFFELDDARFATLHHACTFHADGLLHADSTIGACWDADRLDLPRVGVIPDPKRLCTPAARARHMLVGSLNISRA
jgi:uncharacterized protein